MATKDYKYNLFLSWTGGDRPIKDQLKNHFVTKYQNDSYCYDSFTKCK